MTEDGFRSIEATIHDVNDRTHRVVVNLPHETLDKMNTDFQKGCFAESFARRLPVMLREHDPRDRIGTAESAEVLPKANRIVGAFEPFDQNPIAARTFADIRSGKLKGWSFYFRNARGIRHPSTRSAVRYVRAEMPEFSATATPAIPGTVTLALRSLDLRASIDTADVYARLRALVGFAKRDKSAADPAHVAALENSVRELARQIHLERLGIKNNADELAEDLSAAYGDALDKLGAGDSTRSVLEDGYHVVEQDRLQRRREADPHFAAAERGHQITADIRRLAAPRLGSGSSGRRTLPTRTQRERDIANAVATIDRRKAGRR